MLPLQSPSRGAASVTATPIGAADRVDWRRGIVLALCATACFATLDASAKFLTESLHVLQIVWGRYLFHFLIFFGAIIARANPLQVLSTSRPYLQTARALLLVGATFTFWLSLSFLPLAQAVVIAFASPLLVTALSVPFLGEKVGVHRWTAVLTGLLGVGLIVAPAEAERHWAQLLPLLTALIYAGYQIATRVASRSDSAMTSMFYSGLGGMLVTSVLVPFVWTGPSAFEWLVLVWMGMLGGGGHFLLTKALTVAPASLLAPFHYSTLLWATLLGYAVFGELPGLNTLIGATIIILSGLYIIFREHRRRMAGSA